MKQQMNLPGKKQKNHPLNRNPFTESEGVHGHSAQEKKEQLKELYSPTY